MDIIRNPGSRANFEGTDEEYDAAFAEFRRQLGMAAADGLDVRSTDPKVREEEGLFVLNKIGPEGARTLLGEHGVKVDSSNIPDSIDETPFPTSIID